MTQEASWPTRPVITSFGGVLLDAIRALLPYQLGADMWNTARWTLAGLAACAPKAVVIVNANGSTALVACAWQGTPVSVTKTGTGVYTIDSPGQVTDNRGELVGVTFVGAAVSAGRTSSARRLAEWELTDGDQVTIRTFDSAGVAADSIFTAFVW